MPYRLTKEWPFFKRYEYLTDYGHGFVVKKMDGYYNRYYLVDLKTIRDWRPEGEACCLKYPGHRWTVDLNADALFNKYCLGTRRQIDNFIRKRYFPLINLKVRKKRIG